MTVNIVVPSLGESITEATIAKWHKQAGDQVNTDEVIVELETDKVNLEVQATVSGVIGELTANEGDNVNVGDVIGSIKEGAVSAQKSASTTEQKAPAANKSAAKSKTGQILSPAAQKIASENNIKDFPQASGKDGRITKSDAIAAATNQQSGASSTADLEERVRMSRLRKTIATRLKESQNTAAILSTFNEVDMTAIMNYRKIHQDSFKEKHGVKLGFMSFFVKAIVCVLKEIPAVNAEIDGDDIVYKNYYNIGVAVGTEQGLVVPVVRNADQMGHADIEKEIVGLGKKAREGKLSMADMTGGTFSITNGGIYGSLLSTPIINPPQSGILGMHNIVPRPMAINNEVVIRPMMYLALSYDHRIIDGSEAVTFLRRVKELVEDPGKMLFNL
jgi:2-oxoglutarate dehydrogenase E2 component (dihydrolipoamide succinyltransferase)